MKMINIIEKSTLWLSIIAIILMALYFGPGEYNPEVVKYIFRIYLFFYASFMVFVGIRKSIKPLELFNVKIFNISMALIGTLIAIDLMLISFLGVYLIKDGLMYGLIILLILIGVSRQLNNTLNSRLHPALVFVLSFAILILFGSLMLMLPGATNNGISFLHALFTSTSAVTVTGLAVLDTGKDFTVFGKTVILLLIQFGGLGVLTFSNLFALLFAGGSSFRNQIAMADFINSENLGSTRNLLMRIILFVLVIELLGATLIYISIFNTSVAEDKFFFAIFHSVSAFCNAGFSTYGNSLYEPIIRYNYFLHTIVALLIVFGGLGYNISINYIKYLKEYLIYNWRKIFKSEKLSVIPKNIIRINTVIVVQTTIALLLIGWIAFFIIEYNNTLSEHKSIGAKIAVSFFNTVTPRTAGFNNIDLSLMLNPTVLIFILLMWVGASPGSTGGGIKTTTIAVAVLNLRNLVLGKERLEYRKREIPLQATQRSNVIIFLSLMAIGFAVFLLSIFDPKVDVLKLTFETFSAFCTVGLTLGITPQLSDSSKIVLIIMMFLGRVSLLTFIIAVIRQCYSPKMARYQYAKEEIFIN
jgi:potassium uptake TrkH family protein